MAIRIDLLPGSVKLNRWFQRGIVASVLLVCLVAGSLYVVYYKNKQKLDKYTADAAAIESYASQTEAAQTKTSGLQNDTQPMQTAINFMSDASKTGAERAALLDLIRAYIYHAPLSGAVLNSMDISDGQTVKLNATVRTPDDYARFILQLRQGSTDKGGPLFDGYAVGAGIPGFPPPLPGKNGNNTNTTPGNQTQPNQAAPIAAGENIMVLPNVVTATAKLKHPIVLPPDPVGGAPAPGGAGGGGNPGAH